VIGPDATLAIARFEPPARARAPRAAPFYKRWWFWTAIGVVVTGVTVGSVLGARAARGSLAPGELPDVR